ncbi:MAG: hypothetical protein HRT45_13270, partial [Bdellovibrionales bacterium]|nr:hypothetical protein [Bdellovibrionales bacterium]
MHVAAWLIFALLALIFSPQSGARDFQKFSIALEHLGRVPDSSMHDRVRGELEEYRANLVSYSVNGSPDLSAEFSQSDAAFFAVQLHRLIGHQEQVAERFGQTDSQLLDGAEWLFDQQLGIKQAMIEDFRNHFNRRGSNPRFEWLIYNYVWSSLVQPPLTRVSAAQRALMEQGLGAWLGLTRESLQRGKRLPELRTKVLEELRGHVLDPVNNPLFQKEALGLLIESLEKPINDVKVYQAFQAYSEKHNMIVADPSFTLEVESQFSQQTKDIYRTLVSIFTPPDADAFLSKPFEGLYDAIQRIDQVTRAFPDTQVAEIAAFEKTLPGEANPTGTRRTFFLWERNGSGYQKSFLHAYAVAREYLSRLAFVINGGSSNGGVNVRSDNALLEDLGRAAESAPE